MNREIYDFVAIGLGPFNLSLACRPAPGVCALFLEKKPGFDWHPGMLIEGLHAAEPFLADLSAWPIRAASTAT